LTSNALINWLLPVLSQVRPRIAIVISPPYSALSSLDPSALAVDGTDPLASADDLLADSITADGTGAARCVARYGSHRSTPSAVATAAAAAITCAATVQLTPPVEAGPWSSLDPLCLDPL
jgi:hypothetical protein